MKKIAIIAADETEFFARGKHLAALADAGKFIPSESVISFGNSADLLKMLTPARLALISAVKAQPDSISAIAERLPVAPPRDLHTRFLNVTEPARRRVA